MKASDKWDHCGSIKLFLKATDDSAMRLDFYDWADVDLTFIVKFVDKQLTTTATKGFFTADDELKGEIRKTVAAIYGNPMILTVDVQVAEPER
jgi:hypothetical protein